ncbi:hypothetical protein FQN55_000568 [Onygenales sp. PD_40]|nr:hypothetical protein FQN55_000568 [Onygenales sp. PD_40]KAK2774615.1 hypothetical protein FQN53_003549 [Emmonsiellopsis sp. PD_33]KAK2789387.1 hypothetical protein FQN52_006251 [Onygenales sp. PD_12]
MTLDSALLYRPTERLVLPDRRKFFPFRIPNTHHQLRHYISTADPDRIYVAVERQIYAIHISSRRCEKITVLPFEPKCLTAGLGWIGIGGSEHGDCAFIRLGAPTSPAMASSSRSRGSGLHGAAVDSPLPLDLDPGSTRIPPWDPGELPSPMSDRTVRQPSSDVKLHQFGGSIVNSVTLHRLPSQGDLYTHEDVAVLSNNDTTVSIYSLTQSEMIETIRHPVCMNYAIISPDSKILAAVGDANRIYFYRAEPAPKKRAIIPNSDKLLMGWEWPLIRTVELDADPHYDDCCCFTIAFSPASHLCAVGSQAGIITVFDMENILDTDSEDTDGRDAIVCVFQSSRSYFEGGAVRSMSFSPRPWDLLVWVEDYGRAGVADIRQAFSRRQIIKLDPEDGDLKIVRTHTFFADDEEETSDSDDGSIRAILGHGRNRHRPAEDSPPTDVRGGSRRPQPTVEPEDEATREELIQDLTDRERQIVNYLNASRWAPSEEGPPRSRIPRLLSPESLPDSHEDNFPRPPSPAMRDGATRLDSARDRYLDRLRGQPRRTTSIVLSQDGSTSPSLNLGGSPTITVRWTRSPSQMGPPELTFEAEGSNAAGPSGTNQAPDNGQSNGQSNGYSSGSRESDRSHRARLLFDGSLDTPPMSGLVRTQRLSRARSIPRRQDRPNGATATEQDSQLGIHPDVRENLTLEQRQRLRRQAIIEDSRRMGHVSQLRPRVETNQTRPPPWVRTQPGDDSRFATSRERERGVGTAGIGWGDDSRTLFIGTVQGIFQFELNIQDRKTFPGFSCR